MSPLSPLNQRCYWTLYGLILLGATPCVAAPTKSASSVAAIGNPKMKPQAFTALSNVRIAAIADLLPHAPQGFGPNYHDRTAFEALGKRPEFKDCIAEAVKLTKQEFPPWSDELYLDFSRTGQRPPGEEMLKTRHAWLQPLVWAECLENKGRFVPAIEQALRASAREKSWTLPSHDPDLKNFHGTEYSVDLVSAAFAHDIAQALYMLDDKITPELRGVVLDKLRRHVFAPVLASLKTGKGSYWLTIDNNWNAVCLAGVVGAALACLPDRHERAIFVAAAEHYSAYGVKGFSDDGYCPEGIGYYNYGFSHFVVLRENLWQATKGRLDLFANPKTKNIALFGVRSEIINGVYPAIADCGFGVKADPTILWYCSRVLKLGLNAYESLNVVGPGTAKPGNLARSVLLSFPNSASQSQPSSSGRQEANMGLRSYFEQAGVLVCRPPVGGRFAVVLQGGNNGVSHNHNDIGTFNVVVGNQQVIGDPGGPRVYTSETFGPQRYTKFQIFRSRTHPVPIIAGREQKVGADAVARVVKAQFSDAKDELALDLASAYEVPELKTLTRSFTYSREGKGSLVVRDDFAFATPQTFEITLTTHGSWRQLTPETLELQFGGETLIAHIEAPSALEIKSELIDEGRVPFTRIGIALKSPLDRGTVSVTFSAVP